MAYALTYAGYTSTVYCSGSNFFCDDGGAVCCSLPTGYGYSVQFNDLPAGSQGQGYTNGGCSDFLFSVFGPGTKCWNGGGARASNMNWFYSPQGRRSMIPRASTSNGTCVDPVGFNYADQNGAQKTIRVPEGAAEEVADLYAKKDFVALAAYERYSVARFGAAIYATRRGLFQACVGLE